ncbi:MAG: hypothetical protein J0H99_14145 [Rhodospirillales bacterium]|nr:hypothetical protein [Rhodospirillales bacterium]
MAQLFALLLVIACGGISAEAAESVAPCGPNLPPSKLSVYDAKTRISEEVVTAAKLADLRNSVRGHSGEHFLLADTAVRGWLTIEHRIAPSASDPRLFCNAPARVHLALGYGSTRIFVQPTVAKDDCVMTALRGHQAEHTHAENEELGSFIDGQTSLLKRIMTELKATPATSADAAKAQFETAGRELVRELERRLLARKEELRRVVDTPAALARLADACGGRVGAFRDGSGGTI